MVALVPGQTPFAEVVRTAVGKGYTPTLVYAKAEHPVPESLAVVKNVLVSLIVASAVLAVILLNTALAVNDEIVYT
jgi:hypothetical protein